MLSDIEKETIDWFLGLYEDENYVGFLKEYCHEGLKTILLEDGSTEVYICSDSEVAKPDEKVIDAVKRLAARVKKRMQEEDALGC